MNQTNFVRILVVVAMGIGIVAPAAQADTDSAPMVVYSRSGSNSPGFARYVGGAWGDETIMSSVGGVTNFVVLKNCPLRDETTCLTYDNKSDVNFIKFDGTNWTLLTEISSNSDESDDRNCDIGYEQLSGDALIVYWDHDEWSFGYRTFNGTTLSNEYDLERPNIDGNDYIALYSKPNSDQIVMLTLGQYNGAGEVLSANVWSGTAWSGWTTITSSASSNDEEDFGFAFEGGSGDGLLVYGIMSSNTPRYRTWNGSSWSSETSMSSMGGSAKWVRLVADPASRSNVILMAAQDDQHDLNVCRWSGSSWGSYTELETTLESTYARRQFDIAYEPQGTKALIVYQQSGQTSLRYRTWNGSSWSSEVNGANIGHTANVIQLGSGQTSGEIFVVASDSGSDLNLMRWNGSALSSASEVTGSLGGITDSEPFKLAIAALPGTVPADVPYATDFQSGIGNEWQPQSLQDVTSYTQFAGRYNNSSVLLSVNTTPGQTYALTFDFYAIDSWDGSRTDATGPDYLKVAVGGTEIFNATMMHEWPHLPGGQTYKYTYDAMGNYGYMSGFKDAIYRKVTANFTAIGSVSNITFSCNLTDENGDGLDDESMGIDNVSVQVARFLDISSAAGFGVQSTSNISYGGGVHPGDLDNDGDIDFVLSGDTARVMLQNSDGTFTASSLGDVRCQGAILDFDNDGDLDFFSGAVGGYNTEALFRNNGAGTLANAGDFGLSGGNSNEGLAAADINMDGWADLLLLSGSSGNILGHHNTDSASPAFTGTSATSYGLNDAGDYGNGDYAASGDVNNDGYPDFFYTYGSGKLFVSKADGKYLENAYGISISAGDSKNIGAAFGDYDNDGDLDLFVARNDECRIGYLWRNDRNWTTSSGNFTDVTSSAGLSPNSGTAYSVTMPGTRSAAWGDVDNDGDLDLFILGAENNSFLFINNGDGTFTRDGQGAIQPGYGSDAALVDHDVDGDLDLVINRVGQTAMLLQNRTNDTNYLLVRVIGRGSGGANKAAIGSRVELWNAANTTRIARRDVGGARGQGTDPFWVHFGGVGSGTTYTVRVYLPGQAAPTEQSVVPGTVSSTIGGKLIGHMLTVEQTGVRIKKWREIPNPDPLEGI